MKTQFQTLSHEWHEVSLHSFLESASAIYYAETRKIGMMSQDLLSALVNDGQIVLRNILQELQAPLPHPRSMGTVATGSASGSGNDNSRKNALL